MPIERIYMRDTLIPRHCSRCGHDWSSEKRYSSSEEGYLRKGEQIGIFHLDKSIDRMRYGTVVPHELIDSVANVIVKEMNNPSFNLLCPKCGRLAREFIDGYCSKGFKEGLISVYKHKSRPSLFGLIMGGFALILIAASALFFYFALQDSSKTGDLITNVVFSIFFLAGSGLPGWVFVCDWFIFPQYVKIISQAAGTFPDEEAESVLCDLIKKSDGCLPHDRLMREVCRERIKIKNNT